MSFRKRLPTALIFLAVVFFILQFAPLLVVFLFNQFIIIISLLEFYNLSRRKKLFPQRTLGVILALIISLAFYFKEKISFELVLFVCLLLAALYFLISFNRVEKLPHFFPSIAITFFGALYLSFTLNYFYPIKVERGSFLHLFSFCSHFFGRHRSLFIWKALWQEENGPHGKSQ